MFVVTYYLYYI